jgi:hypothetical protein
MFIIGTPHSKGAGYFVNDNTASGGTVVEDDVRTCPHCQAVILMRQWRLVGGDGRMGGGFCTKCNAPVCPNCAAKMPTEGCIPFIAKLEKDFDMTVKLKQFMKIAGLEPEPQQLPIHLGDK